MKTLASLLLAACMLAVSAGAGATDTRRIPAAAKPAVVSPATNRTLIVNSKVMRLTAGARIHGTENRTIVPGKVPVNSPARVLVENDGDLAEVWLLTAAEAAAR